MNIFILQKNQINKLNYKHLKKLKILNKKRYFKINKNIAFHQKKRDFKIKFKILLKDSKEA